MGRTIKGTPVESDRGLSNAQLAELLAQEAADSSRIRVRAFRRAARSAFLWPERAIDLVASGRDLTELHAVGPFIVKQVCSWIENPPRAIGKPPALRRDFLTMADAKAILPTQPARGKMLHGDLQMHTRWSDGSGTVEEMAKAGEERGYDYLAITDHSKGLKIAGGIDEAAVLQQGTEINALTRPHIQSSARSQSRLVASLCGSDQAQIKRSRSIVIRIART